MAFNLNKNDGAGAPSKKQGFNLGKNDSSDIQEDTRKDSYWIAFVLAMILIGGVSWYFIKKDSSPMPAVDSSRVGSISGEPESGGTAAGIRLADGKPASGAGGVDNDIGELNIDDVSTKAIQTEEEAAGSDSGTGLVAASFKAGDIEPQVMDKKILAGIRKKMKASEGVKINVLGYASSEGGEAVNQAISQARADAFKRFLIRNGIPEGDIIAKGRGAETPVASNETELGRRKNRRVEVSFK